VNLILHAIPFFLAAILVEFAWGRLRGRDTYRFADTVNSLAVGTLSRLRGFLFLGVGGVAWEATARATGAPQWPTDAAWTWVVAFVAYDFCYYWSHRLGHEVNLLWASHVAHHQSEEYNLSTALRQTSTGVLTFVFYLPMFALGVPAEVVVTVGSLNLIYQFWVHTRHVGRLGPLELVFVTPSNHRVHHAQNERYLDRNYGGVFIVWDRLFGTYQDELDEDPPVYGIRKALHSWDPVWANLHVYAACVRDSLRTRRAVDKLGVWLRGPGWRPADLPPHPPFDPARFEKYAPETTPAARGYAGVQFVFAVAAALALLLGAGALPSPAPTVCALLAVAAFWTQGLWLEGRAVALPLELVRLAAWAGGTLWLLGLGVVPATTAAAVGAVLAASAVAAVRCAPRAAADPAEASAGA
jgi:sterol desaturase/sphingolipid hydroxylase (fatty acid hydroxylase superfamily)